MDKNLTSMDIRDPCLRVLPPGVERYLVKGGGLSVIVLDPEDKVELEAHCKWLKAAPTVFADVDTWKIPYPQIPSFD